MDGYICIKALTLAGVNYNAGEDIPAESVLPNRVRSLKRQGYIAQKIGRDEASASTFVKPKPQNTIVIPLDTKDGLIELAISIDSIVDAITKLQLTAEESIKYIGSTASKETLILIDALESRKTVKSAIGTRLDTLEKLDEENVAKQKSGDD